MSFSAGLKPASISAEQKAQAGARPRASKKMGLMGRSAFLSGATPAWGDLFDNAADCVAAFRTTEAFR
jgi:hypothetical protein